MVYQALGVKDNLGYIDTNHSHRGALPANQQAAVDAYVKKFLLDDASVNTSTHWDPVNELDTAKWVDWTAPASLQ